MPLSTRRPPVRAGGGSRTHGRTPAYARLGPPAAETRGAGRIPTPARIVLAALGAVLCALLSVLATAAPASAHAVQTDSSPAEGRVVKSMPKQVTVTFSEGVSMADGSIRVLGPDGKRLDTSKVREVPGKANTRAVGLEPDGPKGTYTVAWKAVSDDSHPVSGAFTFSVGHTSETSAKVDEGGAQGGFVGGVYQAGRYASYAGFVLLVGGGTFVMVCGARGGALRRVQRVVGAGWLALATATLLMLLLRNAYTGTGQLSEVFDLGGLKDALGSKPGAALAARLLLLGTAAVVVAVLFGSYADREDEQGDDSAGQAASGDGEADGTATGERPDRSDGEESARPGVTLGLVLGGGFVAVGLAATWAVAEHASTGLQTQVAMPVDVVHLLAVAAWLGGLVSLLAVLYGGTPPSRSAVRRFSRLAFGSVLVLAATGLYQSWRQVGTLSALTGTSYGRLLLAKAGLVVVLIGLASVSRQWTSRVGEAREGSAGADSGAGHAEGHEREDVPAHVGAPAGEAGADETGTGKTGMGETGTGETGADSETATEAGRSAPTGSGREAQLARQRAAMAHERRRKAREADPERSGLRRSVLAEAAVAAVLLVVTTALTSTEPGRTEELAAAGKDTASATGQKRNGLTLQQKIPFDTGGPGGKGTAVLYLTPGRVGGNSLRIVTEGPDGKQLPTEEVKVSLTLPEQDLGPFEVEFERINRAEGRWRSDPVQLPVAGRWKASVTVRTSDIDQATESRTVVLE